MGSINTNDRRYTKGTLHVVTSSLEVTKMKVCETEGKEFEFLNFTEGLKYFPR